MFSAIISVAYAHNLPCHTVQSCKCNCSMHVLRHAHALHSGSPPNVLHSPSYRIIQFSLLSKVEVGVQANLGGKAMQEIGTLYSLDQGQSLLLASIDY